jgi:uncharacterized protein
MRQYSLVLSWCNPKHTGYATELQRWLMTPQERSLLESFLAQLVQVRGVKKDPEAERMIAQALQQQPDATYLVVQRALLLDQALEQAKARIAALEQAETGRDQGFLDPNASGWGNPAPVSRGQPAPQNPGYAAGQYPQSGPPPTYPAYAAPMPAGGSFSGFLGQAAATAAGVAGGEFLFQGIENLLGSHHGDSFPTEDVTVNNYYAPDEILVENDNDASNRAAPDDASDTFAGDDQTTDDDDFV